MLNGRSGPPGRYTNENLRLFHVSNLSVLNLTFFCSCPGSQYSAPSFRRRRLYSQAVFDVFGLVGGAEPEAQHALGHRVGLQRLFRDDPDVADLRHVQEGGVVEDDLAVVLAVGRRGGAGEMTAFCVSGSECVSD